MVFILILAIGSVIGIHWKSLQGLHQRVAWVQPLYQRQKILSQLTISLERYRQVSSVFRKMESEDVAKIKDKLRATYADGIGQLDQLDPTAEERAAEHKMGEELNEFLTLIAHVEPTLYNRDAYIKTDVLELHDRILSTLVALQKSNDTRVAALHLDSSRAEPQSVMLLLIVGGVIFLLMLSLILRTHIVYVKPLNRLHQYAAQLRAGGSIPQNPPHFTGSYGEIQSALTQLALSVETHMRDRHKFILDIVDDLKGPLTLLQEGRYLIESSGKTLNEEQQHHAAESVRRGLAIFSGSLDDLNDIVDINRLESRLEERTADLSELLCDVSRTLMGPDLSKRISITVPPIPLWVSVDVRRFERALVHVLSKVISTLPRDGSLSVTVAQSIQGGFRGVEILIQDSERMLAGRAPVGGPEQDILRHWISENGLSMALVHKIIKAHGGSIMAAGVAGTSITVTIRLPQERVVSRGLISPPTQSEAATPSLSRVVVGTAASGLVVKNESSLPASGSRPQAKS